MKRLFLSILPLLVGCALSAQTYHDGVWYSLYDEEGFELNTISHKELTLFAPTNGSFTFVSTYNKLAVNVFPKCKTYVYESANGGSSSSQIGQALPDVNLAFSYGHFGESHNNTLTCSRNINWLKFDRGTGNTHVHKIQNLRISLAQHILLASGDYGTTSASYDFGEQDLLSTSEPYMVNLRSFLSAGDITVTSSDPEIFHLGSAESIDPIVYAVGANACASANGTADAASGAALGKIANYAFPVYFTPKESGSYTGTITLTDGVSTATITLSGTGRKLNQSITWDQEKTTILSNETIAPATASSSLEVTYSFSPEGIVTFADGVFSILSDGQVTVTAAQSGNNIYNAAESVAKTFTIFPAVTYNTYEASICEGEVYNDEHFGALTEGRLYYDTIPNVYGGDSVITLTLHVHPLFASEESFNHYLGLPGEWQGVDLSLLSLGDTTLIAAYSSAYGCDSTYTLHLSVLPNPTTYGEYQAAFCDGDSVEFSGKWYTAAAQEDVIVAEKNIYGGDSVVTFTATVLPRHFFAQDTTITMDEPLVWREKEYGLLTPGAYTLYDSLKNIDGCDSVYTMHLTVNAIPYLFQEVTTACQNEEAAWREMTLPTYEAGTFILYDSLQSQYGMDSVYELTLTVYPSYAFEDEAQTIYVGQPGVWREIDLSLIPVGDTILTKLYTTVMGCDSVYTMHLTVNEAPATYGVDSIYICGRGEVAVYDDVAYSKPTKTPLTVTLSTPNQFGGDSIVELWVLASNKYEMNFSQTITEGESVVWQDIDLSVLPAGDTTLTVIYPTIHGCDSTFILTLKVVSPVATGVQTVQESIRPAEKFFLNGKLYIRKNERLYTPQGALITTKKED